MIQPFHSLSAHCMSVLRECVEAAEKKSGCQLVPARARVVLAWKELNMYNLQNGSRCRTWQRRERASSGKGTWEIPRKDPGRSLGRTAKRPRLGAGGLKETFPGAQTGLCNCSPGSHWDLRLKMIHPENHRYIFVLNFYFGLAHQV